MSDMLFELMCAVAASGATLLTLIGGGLWLELSRRRDVRRRQAARPA
ncbi:hypothetical protein [Muricoccus aerilatus]|nr:hypothetical protein [Roseomonas aerilata]